MGTKLIVQPAVVEIVMPVFSIPVPVPIMISIIPIVTPIILIESVNITVVKTPRFGTSFQGGVGGVSVGSHD